MESNFRDINDRKNPRIRPSSRTTIKRENVIKHNERRNNRKKPTNRSENKSKGNNGKSKYSYSSSSSSSSSRSAPKVPILSNEYPIIDIGINLTNKRYLKDLDKVVERAITNNVTQMVITGTSLKASKDAAILSSQYPHVLYSTAGVHPHSVVDCNDSTIESLRSIVTKYEGCVAVGECGLDFNRMFSPADIQKEWFDKQLKLATNLNVPVFLHERDAFESFVNILQENRKGLIENGGVVHCFTGNKSEMETYLHLDMYIGITGWICDERRGKELQKIVEGIPLNRLMIETDGPFLTPRNMKPYMRRNEPAYLQFVLEKVAECKGMSVEEVAKGTTKTAREFFNLDKSS